MAGQGKLGSFNGSDSWFWTLFIILILSYKKESVFVFVQNRVLCGKLGKQSSTGVLC